MRLPLLFALLLTVTAHPQWQLQDAHTTADLRGIDNVGHGVAWASGANGTVLRTEDAGFVWQLCAIPPNADHLDFRAIQAFDNNTAIVMSSGKGDQSRLYKTTDGCQTWTLLFTNPDKDGFWDGMTAQGDQNGKSAAVLVAGDPVGKKFTLFRLQVPLAGSAPVSQMKFPLSACRTWTSGLQLSPRISMCYPDLPRYRSPIPNEDEALFAASNSSLFADTDAWFKPVGFITGGPSGARFLAYRGSECGGLGCEYWVVADLPLAKGSSAGAFSIAFTGNYDWKAVIVGGDYTKPDSSIGTAAYSEQEGAHWTAAATPPHGYRSAVAYDPTHNTWITVGPNGADLSTDDGRNWRPLQPNPAAGDPPDADEHWNALSLPFVVGPHGRIATLRPDALPPPHQPTTNPGAPSSRQLHRR